jgi:hypothetical protein
LLLSPQVSFYKREAMSLLLWISVAKEEVHRAWGLASLFCHLCALAQMEMCPSTGLWSHSASPGEAAVDINFFLV